MCYNGLTKTKKGKIIMKRFLSLTLVAIMLLTTLMLTSCDFINQAKDYVHGIFGIETEEEVRYTITEEEWEKMYDLDNYTVTVTETADGMRIDMMIAVTPDALRVVMEYDVSGASMDMEVYYDVKNNYVIQPDGYGKWVGYPSSGLGMEVSMEALTSEVRFSSLEYDEETKSYVFDDKLDDTIYNFYFENGNFVRLELVSTDPDYPATGTIDNVGTTVVTLPAYTK